MYGFPKVFSPVSYLQESVDSCFSWILSFKVVGFQACPGVIKGAGSSASHTLRVIGIAILLKCTENGYGCVVVVVVLIGNFYELIFIGWVVGLLLFWSSFCCLAFWFLPELFLFNLFAQAYF